jgi:rhodanese-related sulfurtransferase
MTGASLPQRSTSVDDLLEEARRKLRQLSAREALEAAERGAALIDMRSDSQRVADGLIPRAVFIPRNVLEWRLDPGCEYRIPELAREDLQLILICDEGYQSSLAAATLRGFGVDATDVIGGFRAWRAAGLPVSEARSAEARRPARARPAGSSAQRRSDRRAGERPASAPRDSRRPA